MSSNIQVRLSSDRDLAAVSEIYAYHVLHGTGSFEVDPPEAEEMACRRLDVVSRGLPYLVAEAGGSVVGYAYAALFRTRAAYRFTLEDSVYVHRDYTRQGVGSALLAPLIAASREWGCRQLVAVIGDSENTASVRIHEQFGFQHSGVLRGVGYKFERWIDAVFMQLPL